MQGFKDSKDRSWTVSLTFNDLKRVKALLEFDLTQPSVGDPPLLVTLSTDLIALCDCIYVLCKPQADQLQISDEDFGKAMGADAMYAASQAFFQEWADFFHKSHRSHEAKAVERQRLIIARAVEVAAKNLDDPKLMEIVEAHLARMSGEMFTTLQAKLASTPGHSPARS